MYVCTFMCVHVRVCVPDCSIGEFLWMPNCSIRVYRTVSLSLSYSRVATIKSAAFNQVNTVIYIVWEK